MKGIEVHDLPVTTNRYKSIHLGDGVWRIIDTKSKSIDDQVCKTDSTDKADLIIASLNHYNNVIHH